MATDRTRRLAAIHLPPVHAPMGYFVSFRAYGTWLHGDPRGSVDRRHRAYDTPYAPPHEGVERACESRLKHPPVCLHSEARALIERTVAEVCGHRQWKLHAVNARTNHLHIVVTSPRHRPERVSADFKAWCTRRLREAGMATAEIKQWSRGRSNPYLWDEEDMRMAVKYVLEYQD